MTDSRLRGNEKNDGSCVKVPRILLTATSSGSGKTMITCGILKALKNRGLDCAAFKCGPDYIDPMFHREVLGIASYNLDTFMCGRSGVRSSLLLHGDKRDICVLEGVMGYYAGIAGISKEASAWDVADATDTPAILILDCKGLSVSAVAVVKGFLEYESKNHIAGVILNRLSPMMYGRMKQMIEEQLYIRVYGYVPVVPNCVLESRYLGLQLPGEVDKIEEKLERLAAIIEDSVDLDGLSELASAASVPDENTLESLTTIHGSNSRIGQRVRIAVASDEAFCFIYPDNLEILRQMGAEIITFSPLHDPSIPKEIQGIVLYGGYPELYAEKLSQNQTMLESVRQAILNGTPCIAECGGFMYLQEKMQGADGKDYNMAGVIAGKSYKTDRLRRFGYITLSGEKVFGREVGEITAHEFHYYESEDCGHAFTAKKPLSSRGWECMFSTDTLLAGYPHIHYMGNKKVAEAFIAACNKYTD